MTKSIPGRLAAARPLARCMKSYPIRQLMILPCGAFLQLLLTSDTKTPTENEGQPLQLAIADQGTSFEQASENLRFANSVSGLAMLPIDSPFKGQLQYSQVSFWAETAR